jgi:hypothetical protein
MKLREPEREPYDRGRRRHHQSQLQQVTLTQLASLAKIPLVWDGKNMKRPAVSRVFVVCLALLAARAFAQSAEDKNHGDIGVYFDYTRLQFADANLFGIGARLDSMSSATLPWKANLPMTLTVPSPRRAALAAGARSASSRPKPPTSACCTVCSAPKSRPPAACDSLGLSRAACSTSASRAR